MRWREPLPEDMVYSTIQGLRLEAREKLDLVRPINLGQASRISGVSPADISVLIIYLEQKNRREKAMTISNEQLKTYGEEYGFS